MKTVFVTGSAGFIGYHLSKLLLAEGFRVIGMDGMTDYYDVRLKQRRNQDLNQNPNFTGHEFMLEDADRMMELCKTEKPDVIVHLAAQAGVRYSLENPRAYINSNIVGTFNVMECARELGVDHLLMASTSSAYGANIEMPYKETDKAEHPLTIYAATKRANEHMGHSYAHLWKIPTTMFRFFTVYGPWGRPDMAPIKFATKIADGEPIDVYNHGDMYRDFTYVEDLVRAIRLLIDTPPIEPETRGEIAEGDTLSPVAPYRMVNIGNSTKVHLMEFIEGLERHMGIDANKNYMEMQKGDVPATWADAELLKSLTGYQPETTVDEGTRKFVDWFKNYYNVK